MIENETINKPTTMNNYYLNISLKIINKLCLFIFIF